MSASERRGSCAGLCAARRRCRFGAGAGRWPTKADHVCRSVRRRRQHRYPRAPHRPEALDCARAARHHREQAGRGRQHRLRFRRKGETGWLHDPRRDDQLACDQPERLSEHAVRRGEIVRARDPDRQQPARVRRRREHAVQDAAGGDRRGQGEARAARLRLAGTRHVAASRGRAPEDDSPISTSRTFLTRAAVRRSPT